MIIEKPSNEELEGLIEKYGTPALTEREVHIDDVTYKNDYPECKGEGVIKIIKDEKIAGVKHTGGKAYVLPQGRIRKDEKFDEGVKREALEETGFKIKLTALKEVRRTQIKFPNELLERWYLLFESEIINGNPIPEDNDEIENVDFFTKIPWKMDFY